MGALLFIFIQLANAFEYVTPDGRPFTDVGNPTSVKLQDALAFLESIPPYAEPKDEFDPNAMTDTPFEFFKRRVDKIVVDTRADSDECEGGHLAFVRTYYREEKKMWVCPLVSRYDTLTVATTLVHEARHEDGPEHDHRPCRSGPNRGKEACDETYQAAGSYGIELEFLVKLARNPALPKETRERARVAAVRDFVSRFNQPPLDIRDGVLLERQDGSLVFQSDDETQDLPFKNQDVLAIRGGLPVFFEPNQVTEYDFAPTRNPAFLDLLVRDQLANQHQDLLDVVYGLKHACLLLRSKLRCYKTDRTVVERDYDFEPESFVYAPSSRVIEPGAIFVRDTPGHLHRLPEDFSAPWEASTFTMRAIAPWPGGEISLEADGSLHVLSYRSRRWSDGPAGIYRRLYAPFAWSTRLNDLLNSGASG